MKAYLFSLLIFCLVFVKSSGQENTHNLPVIDMHLHIYSNDEYWGGKDLSNISPSFSDIVLTSPLTNEDHIQAVLNQMSKNNIVLAYASGNFGALDFINNADYLTDKQKRDILYNHAAKFLGLSGKQ